MEKRSRAEYRRNSRNVSKVPYEYGSAVRQLNIAEPLKTPDESQQTQKDESNGEESEEEGTEDLGVVSYYYPPLEPSNLMEVVPEPNEEPENETVNYQQQLMETGMLGVPPMNWNL